MLISNPTNIRKAILKPMESSREYTILFTLIFRILRSRNPGMIDKNIKPIICVAKGMLNKTSNRFRIITN